MKYTYFCVMQDAIPFKNAILSFSDVGKGSAVVLIHGFLENQTMWKEITPNLMKKNRVITIDLPGHGNSDCIGYVHSMELLAESIYNVLKHLQIRKCFLVGHSLGGYVSLAFAEKFPHKIKGLCLMNSTSSADTKERITIRNRAIEMVHKNHKNLIRMSFLNLFDKEIKIDISNQISLALQEALKTSKQGYIAMQEGMKIRSDKSLFLQQAAFKKLYVIGKKDPILDFDSMLIEAKKNNAKIVVFENGHMSHIENKAALVEVLKEFLK